MSFTSVMNLKVDLKMCLNLDQYYRESGCEYVSHHTSLMVACISYLFIVCCTGARLLCSVWT